MLKQTPLCGWHKKKGAKMAEFAGYEMPILYTSIVQEHCAVRNSVGLFDIAHMGQIEVEGREALQFLQKLCTNDISKCAAGHGIYSHLLNEQGRLIDDIFVYYLSLNRYLVVVNAATKEKDFEWFLRNKTESCEIKNESERLGMIALQGPNAEKTALKIFGLIPGHHECVQEKFGESPVLLCRTGYTGEDGFEIVAPRSRLAQLWESFLEAGKEWNIAPCGLGARDTLRLEAGYLLYGQDADESRSSVESGPSWVIKFDKKNFIGKEPLLKQREIPSLNKLTAFKLRERGIPRHGSKIFCSGKDAGTVTSGTFSPTLQCGIALGYIPKNLEGHFSILCHSTLVPAEIVKLPFYRRPNK